MAQAEPPDPNRRERQIELEILHLLTDPKDNQPVWALDDLVREMDLPDAVDYIRRLQRSGLVHCTSDRHVFATRAAVRLIQLTDRAC